MDAARKREPGEGVRPARSMVSRLSTGATGALLLFVGVFLITRLCPPSGECFTPVYAAFFLIGGALALVLALRG